jgi:hypothetical protein
VVVRLPAIALASYAGYAPSPAVELAVAVEAFVVVVQAESPVRVVMSAVQAFAVVQTFTTVDVATSLQQMEVAVMALVSAVAVV